MGLPVGSCTASVSDGVADGRLTVRPTKVLLSTSATTAPGAMSVGASFSVKRTPNPLPAAVPFRSTVGASFTAAMVMVEVAGRLCALTDWPSFNRTVRVRGSLGGRSEALM